MTAVNPVDRVPAQSAPTSPVVAVAPANTSPPQIIGAARVGFPLRATNGIWEGSEPITYTYRWQRCLPVVGCSDIDGATADTYTPRAPDDVGGRLRIRVAAHNVAGDVSATSAQTSPVES